MLTEAFLMLLRNDNTTARGNQAKSYLPPNRKPVRARPSAPHGLSPRRVSPPQRRNNWHLIQKARNSAEFRAFFRRRVRRKKLLLRGKCVRARRSADRRARTRAVRAASPHRPAASRPGGRPPLALKGRRGLSGQTRPDLISCLYTAPPRRRGCPARRRTRRRAASRPAS